MCDITCDNFEAKFQEVSYNLQKANFVGLDAEFTGLHLDNYKPSIQDSAEERYKKLKSGVQLYNLIQLGICTFRYCTEQKAYITDTYNFYLFPRNFGFNSDTVCAFQASACEFLCKYDFDYNKLIYKGLPYMNNHQEKVLEEHLKTQTMFAGVERDLDEKLLQKICSDVADWLLRASVGECFEIMTIKDIKDYILHNELKYRFDNILTHQNGNKIIIEKVSKEKRDQFVDTNQNEARKMVDSMIGFTKIFRLLIQFKKPIIVHNGFMDLLFIHEKFYEPLPKTLKEFKKNINEMLPLVYDTKYISIELKKLNKQIKEIYESTVLEPLFVALNREVAKKYAFHLPIIRASTNSSTYFGKARPHEAGYDAYMCGAAFLKLAHVLTYVNAKNSYNLKAYTMNDYFHAMKPLVNKVKLIRATLDHINLVGPDPRPTNIKILFVKSKTDSLTFFELIKAFSTYGHCEVVLSSKNTARVAVDSESSAAYIIDGFKESKVYEVCTYSPIKHDFWGSFIGTTGLVSVGLVVVFLTYKKISQN